MVNNYVLAEKFSLKEKPFIYQPCIICEKRTRSRCPSCLKPCCETHPSQATLNKGAPIPSFDFCEMRPELIRPFIKGKPHDPLGYDRNWTEREYEI